MKTMNSKGFTLIELLIVVAIIAILAAIAIPQFSAYRERAVIASMIADARNVATAEEAYFSSTYSPLTIATAGGNATLGTQNVYMSKGNTLVVLASSTSYTITVSNTGIATSYANRDVIITGPQMSCTKPGPAGTSC